MIVQRELWDNNFPDVDPKKHGYYTGRVLGIESVWTYFSEPEYYPYPEHLAEPRYPHGGDGDDVGREVWSWFEGIAEEHEVWT